MRREYKGEKFLNESGWVAAWGRVGGIGLLNAKEPRRSVEKKGSLKREKET